jgi:hypothetical protein
MDQSNEGLAIAFTIPTIAHQYYPLFARALTPMLRYTPVSSIAAASSHDPHQGPSLLAAKFGTSSSLVWITLALVSSSHLIPLESPNAGKSSPLSRRNAHGYNIHVFHAMGIFHHTPRPSVTA